MKSPAGLIAHPATPSVCPRAQLLRRASIPYLERLVIRGGHNDVSRWTDRTPANRTRVPVQGAPLLPRTRIPQLERLIRRGRHDGVSRWIKRTSPRITFMPTQRSNQCRVWQQVPACQVWARNVLLECLIQF
jgi:hypothetical protein